MTTRDLVELFGIIIAWLISLIVVTWRFSKVVNGVGSRVELLEGWKISTEVFVDHAKLDLVKAQLERTALAKDVGAAKTTADAALAAAALSSDRIMDGIDNISSRLTKLETIVEERIPRQV